MAVRFERLPRAAGVLLPVASLTTGYGIGDLGPAATAFLDWLAAAKQRYWQILPLTIPDSVGSPYSALSTEAGNWLLISPERLVAQRLLPAELARPWSRLDDRVRYRLVARYKQRLLRQAFVRFQRQAAADQRRRFTRFVRRGGTWLETYTLFQAIKDWQFGRPWWRWPKPLRRPATARAICPPAVTRRQEFVRFVQWMFDEQWSAVRRQARQRGIKIIGDLSFYVAHDSSDVWSQPTLFALAGDRPATVAGVPPDDLSARGQVWHNPVYRWGAHRHEHFRWWLHRFAVAERWYDAVRLDHFRGYVATWHIPARRPDSRRGGWAASPGAEILRVARRRYPRLGLLAEDLGVITPEVTALRRRLAIPGMRVLQYAWSGLPDNPHHPDRIDRSSIVYTSTHDTNTTVGWWRSEAEGYKRRRFLDWTGGGRPTEIHWRMIAAAYRTAATLAIVPAGDVLGLGAAARVNRPGTKRRNWSWRLLANTLTAALARRLAGLVRQSGRYH